MKRLMETNETAFESLMGEYVTIFSLNYIYHGKLVGINEINIMLEDAKIVYETGAFSDKGFKNAQSLECKEYYIQIGTIESFGVLSKKND